MFTEQMWPTYLFFISMGIGILFLIINRLARNFAKKWIWQVLLGILPLAAFLIYSRIHSERYLVKAPIAEVLHSTSLRNGDIIFQTSTSSQSRAIQLATHSEYSHMGIIYEKDGEFVVLEAVQPVKTTPIKEWMNRGRNGHYVVKRLKNADLVLAPETLAKMKQVGEQFLGKPYDIYFEWSDEKIYCSELVWKIYKHGANIEIGQLESLSDFDLTSEIVVTKMRERYGDHIPMNEKVISPAEMFNSDKLILVEEK
jgi:hypothetical protein